MPWSQIQGHERWIEMFRHARTHRRMAHAYLFVGPPGIGKRLFALELAKAILCERNAPGQLEACGACDSCRLVDARTHPDFFLLGRPWIDPETQQEKNELPIDLMRELCAGFGLKAARGHGKVAVVDDADDFNEPSANCFLKTLEEPPPGSVFLLISNSLDSQRATIRSRCQVIRFAPLRQEVVRDILSQRELADPQLLPRLVKLAAGSPGLVIDLADPALWQFRNRLLQGLAQPKIDSVGLAKSFVEFAEDAGKETVHHRRRAAQVLKLLLHAWTDVLQLQLSGGVTPALSEEAALLEPLARRARPDQILHLLERCLEAEMHLDRYIQVGLVLEALLDALGQILEP